MKRSWLAIVVVVLGLVISRESSGAGPAGAAASLYDLSLHWEDAHGSPVEWQSLRGRVVVVTMFFSSCTYACPRITADMKTVASLLPERARDRVVFVMASFDTENDQPAALEAFANSQGLNTPAWLLLHGGDDAVRLLAAALDIRFRPDPAGGFAHSNGITVLDPRGVVVYRKDGLGGDLSPVAVAAVSAAAELE